ncbi:DNA-binding SARP family transcriptional activator/Tfp pilus assembly protein PilF [Actinophytocola algeriensis]|uniref:DNA-binding SARP family transcriptional activator/Tfp pilus assembly protein PilF n=2 Tax=Actinophytocola algeriensis TaxID=1768010 RepID=A0A7W7Q2R5_9PSEU|nr:DNA-binding SARP family transcriptional activator/Tfp pilus assembly protein PilF [Actinophytocola algeriensis]MBE1472413.1 DNA-binding SARP family transcriptional activator/Tfp pilus assembly protein PilF [Actinophytocola algeriensis]
MTQRELADQAAVSAGAIRDLEQGRTRNPKRNSVQAIATALGLSGEDTEHLHAAAGTGDVAHVDVPPVGGGPLRIRVLGPVEVWHGDVQAALGSGLQRTLLARLALGAGSVVAQDELIDLLWGHGEAQNAAGLLHTQVTRLRRLLGIGSRTGGVLVGGPAGYRLAVDAEHLDLLAFRDLVARAAHDVPEEALRRLAGAVALWRGEIDVERVVSSPIHTSVTSEYAAAVRTYATLARNLGRPEEALAPLHDLARRHELDEPLHAELVLTLAASGRQAEALTAYDRIRSALGDQLGIDPGEQLRSAQLAVLRRRDRHALRATEQAAIQQAPAAPPDFVGRAEELDRIEAALARPDDGTVPASSRVVLIDGIAGVGKTALALAAAHRLRPRYPDGQLYADLRGATTSPPDPMQVLGRFLRALDVPSRRIGTDVTEAAAVFRSELADRRMLVLLDNARDADQIRPLLPGAGGSDVIVTSRRRMPGLAGLNVVDLEPLTPAESVALIAATAGAHRADADPGATGALAEACARLPLALRIASARLATRQAWTIGDMTARLRDDNHRLTELATGESSVLSSFQLSYADLSGAAQRAFRLCALHPGDDFGADSTGALLAISTAEAERLLEDLLEANMLMQYSAERYRFHDLLGLYARRLLADDAERAPARSRLHAWYADAVTAAMEWVYPQLVRLESHAQRDAVFTSEADALAWLDAEVTALVAVVLETAASEEPALSWRITDQLRGYFMVRRHVDGWVPAAEAGLAAATSAGDDLARTAMLISSGQALWSVGREEEALADCLAGERLAVASGWTTAVAYLSHHVAWIYLEQGRLAAAEERLQRVLELTEDDRLGHVRAVALNALGVLRLCQGELREAADLLGAALEINEATGRETSALANRGNLASALRQLGAETQAEELLTDVLAAYRKGRNLRGELSTLDEWSELHRQRGDAGTALEVARQAHGMAITVRDRKITAQTSATVAHAHLALGDTTAAIQWFEDCLTIAHDTYPFVEARALAGLATARLLAGDPAAASDTAERAVSIARSCGFRLLEEQASAALHVSTR